MQVFIKGDNFDSSKRMVSDKLLKGSCRRVRSGRVLLMGEFQ
jgi:hypothetical protein